MASRTSIYTSALKLPDWVMGGEFGDISGLMNQRDLNYEQVQQAEQINDKRQYELEQLQREEELRKTMSDRLENGDGTEGPITLRDMYGRMRDTARDVGSVDDYLKMQEKIDAIDRQKTLDAQQAEYKDALIGATQRRGTGRGRASALDMVNPITGEIEYGVDLETANELADAGYVSKKDPLYKDKIEQAKTAKAEAERKAKAEASGPGWFDGLFGGRKAAEEPIKKQEKAVADIKETAPGKGAEKTAPNVAGKRKPITAKDANGNVITYNPKTKQWE